MTVIRGKIKYKFLVCLGIALALWVQYPFAQHSKPNIIIIIADDLGYGDVSCNGGWIQTPNIDRLAAEGVRFTDFHSSGVVCSPTRAGIMTGLYQFRVGVPGVIVAFPGNEAHTHGLDTSVVTFPELFKKKGYITALFGKWHLGYSRKFNPVHYGFDQFKGYLSGQIDYQSHIDLSGAFDWWHGLEKNDEPGYTTHLINQYSIDFIKENKNNPFCLVVSHEAVHGPYQGPDDKPFRKEGISSPQVPAENQVRSRKETFRLMTEELDKGVGQIIKTLDETGLAKNTCVIFLSDNGGVLNVSLNAPFRGGKTQVWEGGHRVPAIAWWPGRIGGGRVNEEQCISLDIMPTVLDFAGIKAPESFRPDGKNLSRMLLKGKSIAHRQLFWHTESRNNGYAVREKNWKLVGSANGDALLFDLSKDEGEKNDLAEKNPHIVKKMQQAYQIWKKDVGVDKYKKLVGQH